MKRTRKQLKPVTIREVAAAANVSIKTVSRLINREPNVRDELRKRVEVTIQELNFQPSPSARNLATRRSYLIGLFYDNPSANYLLGIQGGALQRCLLRL